MHKWCLRTNTYFQVIKELSLFSYCSIISSSRKALGFQEHSHDRLPSNRGYMVIFSSVVSDRTFQEPQLPSGFSTCTMSVGGGSLDLTFFAHFLKLNSPVSLLQIIYMEGQNPPLPDGQQSSFSLVLRGGTFTPLSGSIRALAAPLGSGSQEHLSSPSLLLFPFVSSTGRTCPSFGLPLIVLPDYPSRTHLHHCQALGTQHSFLFQHKAGGWGQGVEGGGHYLCPFEFLFCILPEERKNTQPI